MASEGNQTTHELLTAGVSTSIHDIQERELSMNALLKAVRKYDRIRGDDLEVKNRMRQVILGASKRMIERKRGTHEKSLIYREGTLTRLRGIVSYSDHLCDLLEPVLLHIDEINYARSILGEFMPMLEEAARYATKLDAEMAAELLRVLDTADSLGVAFHQGLREVFEEIIQIQITPRMLDEPSLLIGLAQRRFQEGEYLTSYLLSREAARVLVEDLTGAYPKDLGPEESPSPEWRFEDYLGYLIEVGLVPEEQGKEFLDLFVGEPEHLNNKWKGKRSAEKALSEMKSYLEKMGLNDISNNDWL